MATISVSLPSDGSTGTVSQYNTPITTIVNAINGGLDNANIASAAAIDGSKLASNVPSHKLSNSYKFRAVAAADQTSVSSNTWTTVTLGTESYDTNSNFASNTYTAPAAGFYHFDAQIVTTSIGNSYRGGGIRLLKNGTDAVSGSPTSFDDAVSYDYLTFTLNDTIQLAAGDTIVLQGLVHMSAGTGGFAWGSAAAPTTRLACFEVSGT